MFIKKEEKNILALFTLLSTFCVKSLPYLLDYEYMLIIRFNLKILLKLIM